MIFSLYNSYLLPKRGTKNAAGYDIFLLEDLVINPGEIKKIPTGLKCYFESDEVLLFIVRSSTGFKYNIRLCNQVGVIDQDYYNNSDNEGHMWVALQTEGNRDYEIKKGTAYCQGIFVKYLTCGDEVNIERESGIGSTNK